MKFSIVSYIKPCLFLLMLCYSTISHSQAFLINYSAPPENATSCNEATKLTVKLNVLKSSINGGEVTINLADGMEYMPATVTKIAGTPGVDISENGGSLNEPKFTVGVSTLSVGDYIEFTILRKAVCDAYNRTLNGEVFQDEVIATIDNEVSTEISSPYTIKYPSLTFIQPNALNDVLIGDIKTRTFSITNGADGCAKEIHFGITYNNAEITQQSLTLGGTTIYPASSVGDTYYYTIRGSLLSPDQQLCNGETLVFTETIKINSCSPSTDYTIGWGCNSNVTEWCTAIHGTGSVNMVSGTPVFYSNTNTKIDYVDMCTPFKVQTDFRNTGTGHATAATMYNVKLKKGRGTGSVSISGMGGNFVVSNPTINNQTVPYNFNNRILTITLEDYFTTDPDGPGGLADIDGDGFFDDLPSNSQLTIVSDFSMNCAKTCGANSYMDNFAGVMEYTTMCSNSVVKSNRLYAKGSSLGFTFSSFITTGYIPPNIENNVPFRARFSVGYYRQVDDFDSGATRYQYEVTLPPGVSVHGSGNVTWQYNEYPSTSTPIPISYTQSGNILTIVSPSSAIGYALIDLVYDCSGGTNITLDYKILKVNNPQTGCMCQSDLACGSLTALVSCPNSCSIGPSTQIPVVERSENSLGWTDNTLTTKQIKSNISAYDLSKALYLDQIEVHGNAVQNGPSNSIGARLRLAKKGNINKLTPLTIDVLIKRGASTVASGTLNSFSTNASTSTDQIIDWDLSALVPSGGLLSGDVIETISYYQVATNNLPQNDVQSGGEWYFYNTDPVSNTQVYCNYFVPEMYLVGTQSIIGTNTYRAYGCDISSLGSSTNYLARRFNTSGIYYQSEYRPVMYVESITAEVPEGYDLISGSIEGLGEITPDHVAGNTYTFNNPGTWPGVGLTVANNYGRRYPFKVRATCNTQTSEVINFHFKIKDYYYHYAENEPNSTALEIIKTNTRTITHYDYPQIELSNLTGDIQASNQNENWVVRMANPGAKTAPYTWLAIENQVGVVVNSVTHIASNTVVTPTAYPGGNLYTLETAGITSGNFEDYKIDFSYTSCERTVLQLTGGWNCNGFPANPSADNCSHEVLPLAFTPANGEIEVISVSEPTTAIDICTPLDYEFQVNSVQSGNIINPTFTINAPQGMNPTAGSFQVEYPVGSGVWESISGTNTGGSIYAYNLNHSNYPTTGLPGTLTDGGNANLRLMGVRFQMATNCNFVAGSNFQVSSAAVNVCGTPALGSSLESQTVATNVAGVTADYSVVSVLETLSGSFNNCNTPITLRGKETIIASSPIGATGFVDITMPIGYAYTANSYTCTSPICATFSSVTTNSNGNEVIRLLIPEGMDSGDFFTYTFSVSENQVSCGDKTILVTAIDETENITCASEASGYCPILSVQTGSYEYDFNVDRAKLTLESTSTTATLSGGNEQLTAAIKVINNSSYTANSGTVIEAFYDADNNGAYSAADVILSTKTISAAILAGNTLAESINFTVPSSQVCAVFVMIRASENDCFCTNTLIQIRTPDTVVGIAGNDVEVCEINTTVTLGKSTSGYTYQWSGPSAAETAYLNNNQLAQPVFNYAGPRITAPITIPYTVTITRPNGCRSTDVMQVMVVPSPQATIATTDASCNQNNGSIAFTFNDYPNQSDISFSLNGSSTFKTPVSDASGSVTYSNLAAGNYNVWARWGTSGCAVDLGSYTINTTPEVAITVPPTNQTVFIGSNAYYFATVNNADTYQWQVRVNGGNYVNITDGLEYAGVNTTTLKVIKPGINKNKYRYRVVASNSQTPSCNPKYSSAAYLYVKVRSVITNRRITHRVKK